MNCISRIVAAPALVCLVFSSACSGPASQHLQQRDIAIPCEKQQCATPMKLTYLGTAGFRIEYGEDVLLLSPFFSNPGLSEVLFSEIEPDYEVIEQFAGPYKLATADAIFLGHGHYDHALDVPYIAKHFATDAHIYGNQTTINQFSASPLLDDSRRLHDVSPYAINLPSLPGANSWPERSRIHGLKGVEYLAIESIHSPHFCGQTLANQQVSSPDGAYPSRASDWKSGKNLSFVFEFRRPSGPVEYRIFYLDAVMLSKPTQTMSCMIGPEYPEATNIVISSVSLYDNVEGQPQDMLSLIEPDHVILAHWDEFSRDYASNVKAPRQQFTANVDEYIRALECAEPAHKAWLHPGIGTTMTFGGPAESLAGAQPIKPVAVSRQCEPPGEG